MRKIVRIIIVLSLLQLNQSESRADVRLPYIFGDGMVLQRGKAVPIWGWADPGEKVTVTLGKQKKITVTDQSGRWRVDLASLAAGGPYIMEIKGRNSIRFSNVLSGEVWLCSGQSNMELEVKYAQNAAAEIAAGNYPLIRQLRVPVSIALQEQSNFSEAVSWKTAVPDQVGEFSAVAYFFARQLYQKLKVPIGIINASKGATTIEPWMSKSSLENSAALKDIAARIPTGTLENTQNLRKQLVLDAVKLAQGSIPDSGNTMAFERIDYNHAHWPQMNIPSIWELGKLKSMDGVVWFRKEMELEELPSGADSSFIQFGFVDDNDQLYINGVQVGASRTPQAYRRYFIPRSVLKKGKNLISLRVEDTGGNGGFYGSPGDFVLLSGSKKYPLSGDWHFQVTDVYKSSWEIEPNTYPSLLFNTMIHPLIPFGIAGMLWYQGEGNVGGAGQYSKSLPALINDWRSRWKQELPFYLVQLSGFEATGRPVNSNTGSYWAELREAQASVLNLTKTGMAVTTDIGNAVNIHPGNKQDVGKRLAALALNRHYGKKMPDSGPVFKSMTVIGSSIQVNFDGVYDGFRTLKPGEPVRGFEIAGADRKFYKANAVIKDSQLIVSAEEVESPVIVRYNWADYTDGNLFNSLGFPAAPFRSDSPFK